MKVVLLCGGKGTRLREETEYKPKPLVSVGGRPILWHIMKLYSQYGYKDFVLCLGYKGDMIRDYFLKFEEMVNDVTVKLRGDGRERVSFHKPAMLEDWTITFVDTGQETLTGSRIARIEPYLGNDETFLMTYGDGVSDVNIPKVVEFHRQQGKIATLSGVHPNSRFGILEIDGNLVTSFSEKPQLEGYVNGGFAVFNRGIFRYLSPDGNCILEQQPLRQLAAERQLAVYKHEGFFYAMDTYLHYEELNKMWDRGIRPWVSWDVGAK
ncbi:MAG: glucose-1-phosphate cytidylyltransferase [bacterium]|nr:glucose-1-phosphate cytidylyltransferase [bacterium]